MFNRVALLEAAVGPRLQAWFASVTLRIISRRWHAEEGTFKSAKVVARCRVRPSIAGISIDNALFVTHALKSWPLLGWRTCQFWCLVLLARS
jgi:predicted nucleic acid-binding Zn ribbon protein